MCRQSPAAITTRLTTLPILKWVKIQRKLLSNSIAKTDNATISNAHVNGVKSGNGTTTASISYSLNGETVDE